MCAHPNHWIGLAVLLSCAALTVTTSQGRRKLTEAEARELVVMALRPEARALPKLRVDADNAYPDRPGFYWFEATAFVPDASPVLGHFAVNQASGDVWDPVSCRKVSSADLAKLQAELRNRLHLSERDLRRLSKVAPCKP